MFDHDADRMRGAGLTAFTLLAEPKAMLGATGATGCLSSPEYPKGMNGPTGITGGLPDREEGGFLPLLRGEWIPI